MLADRGLTGGVSALALAHPRPVEVDAQLDGRPPAPVESAVYFSVAEALTNSAKHSAAQNAWIWMRHDGSTLTAMVGDNGVGGAQLTPEGGLVGIERRLSAFDGTMSHGQSARRADDRHDQGSVHAPAGDRMTRVRPD